MLQTHLGGAQRRGRFRFEAGGVLGTVNDLLPETYPPKGWVIVYWGGVASNDAKTAGGSDHSGPWGRKELTQLGKKITQIGKIFWVFGCWFLGGFFVGFLGVFFFVGLKGKGHNRKGALGCKGSVSNGGPSV